MLNKLRSGFVYQDRFVFKNRLVLAPMAGITDAPFRKIIREYDCGLIYCEMLSAGALAFGNGHTYKMLRASIDDREEPNMMQIYGADPMMMAKAARICEDAGVKMLDINMGCPTHKVYKTGSGSALMVDPRKCRELIRQVRKSIRIPLSVKIRSGVDEKNITAVEIARIAEEEGVGMIAVHPRTREQMFKGKSNWAVITQVKEAVRIPVIGNGDVTNSGEALRMLEETGCDLVMVGRACRGKPWLFREMLNGQGHIMSMKEKYDLITRHLKYMIEYYGEKNGVIVFRKHLLWYVEGFRGALAVRHKLATVETEKEIVDLLFPYYH